MWRPPASLPAGGPDGQDRQVVVRVLVAVAHAAAVEEQRVIEQGAVAVRRGFQPIEEAREQPQVVGVDLGLLGHLLGDAVVVRHRVMPVRDADLRIGERAELAGHHERRDARHVPLIGERHELEHQLDVLFPVLRHADRHRRRLEQMIGALALGLLDAPLDFADVLHVLAELGAIPRPEAALEIGHALSHRVEDARVLREARLPRGGRRAVAAEHPLEDDARVDLHRERLRRRPPRDGAHVRAEVIARAAAEVARVILGGELHRRERRVLSDLRRDDLIDRRAEMDDAAL